MIVATLTYNFHITKKDYYEMKLVKFYNFFSKICLKNEF